MGKKKEQMTQLYSSTNNEFIFGENGGRGKHLSSFMKHLTIGGSGSREAEKSSTNYEEMNSNIYGSLSYSRSGLSVSDVNSPIGGSISGPSYKRSFSGPGKTGQMSFLSGHHSESGELNSTSKSVSSNGSSKHNHKVHHGEKLKYKDLDDDWDADLDEVSAVQLDQSSQKTPISFVGNASKPKMHENVETILLDPLYPSMSVTVNPEVGTHDRESVDSKDFQAGAEVAKLNVIHSKYAKFSKLLSGNSNISLPELRKLSWNGIPAELRALTWQMLLGYLPTNKTRQEATLRRKRQEYADGLAVCGNQIFFENDAPSNNSGVSISSTSSNSAANKEKQLYHQIKIDVKRTNPSIKLYSYPAVQSSLRKVLFLWAVRHPASGYVQGINDLCTPFFSLFLSNYIIQLQRKKLFLNKQDEEDYSLFIPGLHDTDDPLEDALLKDPNLFSYTTDNIDPKLISQRVFSIIEADTYWCLSRLLETITDNYIQEQPGIIKQVQDLKTLISKIDLDLLRHLDNEGVEFIQFAFRWINCLLMREMSLTLIIRMWDTYLSENPLGFNHFHVYVCAAFLVKFAEELKRMDFQDILLFLQNPPTSSWTEKEIEMMLSEAFIWQSLYKNATAHLK